MGIIRKVVDRAIDHTTEKVAEGALRAAGVAVATAIYVPLRVIESVANAADSVANTIRARKSEDGLVRRSKSDFLLVARQTPKLLDKTSFNILVEGESCEFVVKTEVKWKDYLLLDSKKNVIGKISRVKWKRHKCAYRLYVGCELIGEVVPSIKDNNLYEIENFGWTITSNMLHNKFVVTNEKKKKIIEITYTSDDNNTYVIEYVDECIGLYAMMLFVVMHCIRSYEVILK